MPELFRDLTSERSPIYATWAIWTHLSEPSFHPVFRRVSRAIDSRHSAGIASAMLLIGTLICGSVGTFRQLVGASPAVIGFMALLIFSSSYVLIWVILTAGNIVKEHENGTYDLLCLSPYGALNTHTAICSACLHYQNALMWIGLFRKLMAGVFLAVLLLAMLVTATQVQSAEPPQCLVLLAEIMLLALALYYDHVQTTVMGSLIGMLVPVYSRSNRHAALWAGGFFVALQVTALFLALVILQLVIPRLGLVTSPTLASLLAFYAPRESFNLLLWRTLVYHLNAAPAHRLAVRSSA